MTIFKSSNENLKRADYEEKYWALLQDLNDLNKKVDELYLTMAMRFKHLDEKLANSHMCTELVLIQGEYKCKACGQIFDKK